MANLLSNTTIGGYQSIHTGNIGSYALTSLPSHNHDDRYFTETESDGRFQPLENQRVSTSSTVRFSNTYTTAWFRNDNSNTGLYNESTTMHWSSNENGFWDVSSTNTESSIRFYTGGHKSALRGYLYANSSNYIGFLTNGGNWSLRTDSAKNTTLFGNLTVGQDTAASSIFMSDSDEGMREIHCNSNRIGFLTQAGSWGAYADDSANWFSNGYMQSSVSMYSPIYYDSNNSGYYMDLDGISNIWRLQVNGKYTYFGSSDNWDNGNLNGENSVITNVHFQGHPDFWIGAGNTKWYTSVASGHHDLLINTMQASGGNIRGITFTASTNGGSVYRLGRWFSHNTQVGSYLQVDGGIKIGGTTDNYIAPVAKLQVIGSTAGTDVLAVDGVYGRLFTVTDDLSDSLFSVNTIAGLPVIEAFADNTVKIGKYGSNSITISNSKIAINSDTVDANFPFYVGDRSVAGSRYSLTNKGMGFNLADNYAQLQLFGGNGAYIDFVTSTGEDSGGRIMWNGSNFVIGGNMYFNDSLYTYTLYDRNDTGYYLDMNGTSRLGTVNANELRSYGNTYLGDGNGDTTYINDILYLGATDSGNASLYFGESDSGWYGAHLYWDSGVTFTWYTRNAGTDTALFDYVTNDTAYVNWRRNFNMQGREINFASQVHFSGGTRFVAGDSNYLTFRTDSTGYGAIVVKDGSSVTRGYSAYYDSSGFGLLNSSGAWGIRLNPGNVGTELFYAGDWKLRTGSGGIGIKGNLYTDNDFGFGLVGLYASDRYQGVFAMGDSYKLAANGTSPGSLYGIAWTHTNVGGESKSGLGHQALFMTNGVTQTAIGTGIWTNGLITTTSYGTSANWNTAFGWGNHASAGYLTSLPSHNHDDRYYTESEIDSQIGNRLYQSSVGVVDVNAFNSTGLYRGSTGSWTNRPSITDNSGALLQIDTHPGNYHTQLFFDSSGTRLYLRSAIAGSWGSWVTMLHSGNYTSYSPSLTGGGASGTWSINVTGSAGTAINLSGTGGSYIQSTSTGTSYGANYQIRENAGGSGSTNEIYAPQLAFHWGGVVASSIMMESSGRMAIRNNPGGSYENFIAAVIYSSGYGDSTQWNTAYSWGNHASAGYVTSSGSVSYATTAGSLTAGATVSTLNVGAGTSFVAQGYNNNGGFAMNNGSTYWGLMWNYAANDWRLGYGSQIAQQGWNLRWDSSGNVWANASMRAPIFYDSDDTSYYVNPNGTSVLSYLTLNAAESLGVYGVRGKFTNEFIHLYNKVGIGHPGGWGQGEGSTPNYGLSTYGGANFAYGNGALSTFNGQVNIMGSSMYVTASQLHIGKQSSGTAQMSFESWGSYTGAIAMNASGQFHWGGQGATSWYWKKDCTYNGDYSASGTTVMSLSNAGTLSTVRYTLSGTGAFMEGYGSYSSKLGRVAMISFDWNSNYDEPYNHGIMSTNANADFADSISINSFNDITLRLDANNNNSESYLRIMNNTQGNSPIAYIGHDGGSSVAWFGGVVTAVNDFRAPIFYDLTNTNFYGDFASTSVMNSIRFGTSTNNGTLSGNSDWGMRLTTDVGYIQFGPANSSYAHIYTDRANFYFNRDLLVNGNTVIHAGNIGSQSVSYASSAGNADTVDGYHASTSTIGNYIVVRDGNGYIFGNYINMTDDGNPGGGTGITSFITKQGDNYYRSVSPTNAMVSIRGVASGSWGISVTGSAGSVAWTNVSSRPTALSQFSNDLGNYGGWLTTGGKAADSELLDGIDSIYFVKGNGTNALGRTTTNNSGANSAGGLSSGFYDGSGMSNMPTSDWYHLIVNAHHNSATSNQYEFQLATAFWDKSNFYVRSISPGDVGPWRTLVHNGNIGSQSVNYANSAGSASTAGTATIASQLNKFGDIYGQDWNSYYVQDKLIAAAVYGHSGANRPNLTYDYGCMLSYGEASGPRMQMYFPENSPNLGTIFRKATYRTGWNGNWSTWKTLVEQEGNTCTIVGGVGAGLEVHGNPGYNQDPLTYFLLRGAADTSWKAFKVRLTGDAGGQDIEFRRIAENGTDSRMWYVPRGVNTVNFDYPIVQPSDSRLKNNITPISTPVDKIKSLRGVEFDWNSGEQVGTHDVGLIAQDVEAVLPEAVTTQEDGYKNLAYTKVIPLLVEAMKEQQTMIEALRAEVELLKNK